MVSTKRFWDKVRRTAGKLPFVDDAVTVWFCARDPRTPLRIKAILLGAIAYFVLPFDLIPDMLAVLGYADDLAVVTAAIRAVSPHISDVHRTQARAALSSGDFPA